MTQRPVHRWLDDIARTSSSDECLKVLAQMVHSLPESFRYSQAAAARLCFDDQQIETKNFKESAAKLQFPVCDGTNVRGSLELCYTDSFPLADEGPFFDNEIELLQSAARIAGFALERNRMFSEFDSVNQRASGHAHTSGQVISALRYQMRAPLNGILGFAEMLLSDQLTQEQRDAVSAIQSGAESVLDITDSILDYARLEEGCLELNSTDLDIRFLINGLSSSVEERTGRLIELKSSVPQEIDTVLGDGRRIREALESLISYCASLDVERLTKTTINLIEEGNRVRLSAEVFGPHVSRSHLSEDELFNPFNRGDGSNVPNRAVLELAIARGLARLMDGDLIVDSVENAVIFRLEAFLTLPSTNNSARPSHASDASLKVLVADDSRVIRVLASKILTSLGHEVETANDGKEALAMGSNENYDLILMDINMPNMSGFEATRALRDGGLDVPIVSISSSALSEDRRQSLESGMNGFVTKPFKRDDLRTVLSEHCGVTTHVESKEEPLKVLVVDDDKVMRKLVRMVVKRNYPNAIVKTAEDGLEACALLGSFLPRLVITDIIIPGVDGVAVVRFINERERYQNTAVVAMSSLGVKDERVKTLRRLGAKQVLPKPFDWDVFSRAVSAALCDEEVDVTEETKNKTNIVPMPIAYDSGTNQVPIWNKDKGLRSAGGCSSLLNSVVGVFFEDVSARFDALKEGLSAGDMTLVQMQSHTLKGSAAAIGAERLSRVSYEIEMASRVDERDKITRLIPHLEQELDTLTKLLLEENVLTAAN